MGVFGSYRTMNQSPRTLLQLPVVSEFSVKSCIEIQVVRLHPGLWNDILLDDIPVICDLSFHVSLYCPSACKDLEIIALGRTGMSNTLSSKNL